MAAILPYYGDEEEAEQPEHDAERMTAALSGVLPSADVLVRGSISQKHAQLAGLGAVDTDSVLAEGALEAKALNTTHAGLLRQAWTRSVVADQMGGNINYVVTQIGRTVYLSSALNIPGAAWELNSHASDMVNVSLLTWTSKMGCWSFSLPAGAPVGGGTCPGSVAGQSLSSLAQIQGQAAKVKSILGKPVSVEDAICQRCYATGNTRYGRTSMIVKQTLLYAWVLAALKDGSFVDVMTAAINNADTLPYGGDRGTNSYLPERWPKKFFRIHDSGDFFSLEYLKAWKQVARNCPDFVFWAPTRMWAHAEGSKWIREVNGDYDPRPEHNKSNLIIRPSNYHFNEQVPDKLTDRIDESGKRHNAGSGYAAWSTAFDKKRKPEGGPGFDRTGGQRVSLPVLKAKGTGFVQAGTKEERAPYDWDCQAYLSSGGTCRNACAPDGQFGCRACWMQDTRVINYTAH
jgi:hypothetical protein